MRGISIRVDWRAAPAFAALATLALLAAPAAGAAAGSGDGERRPAAERAAPGRALGAAERVSRYWTPRRMRDARPLDLVVGEAGPRLRVGRTQPPLAAASFRPVAAPDQLPYAVNGRIFLRQGKVDGYCSGTAIDSPTRQLVLTAAHCVNSGPEERPGGRTVWSRHMQFVPAYTGGVAPFGSFVARRDRIRVPRQWLKLGNPTFDVGAFLTHPNDAGVNLADAVGGGARIVLGQTRKQRFLSFGYPGSTTRMQGCRSGFAGDDRLTYPFPGPPTLGIRCHWAPGASGGGWLIGDGSEINGLNSYLHLRRKSKTYGPYFSQETVGRLVRGL